MRRSLVTGRAHNYELLLEQCWEAESLEERLVNAKAAEDVTAAFDKIDQRIRQNFVPRHAALILQIVNEKRFPAKSEYRRRFIADSLGGEGVLSPRRSRDICEEERAKTVYKIIRREYYVECSCGYQGPALDDACRICGAKIGSMPLRIEWGSTS